MYNIKGDVEEIERTNGKTEVISELCNLNYIDNKTLQFFSIIFNIPKKKFKCYRNKQLSHQHWS